MKKILTIAAFAVLSMSGLMAQNTFQGTIIFKATSTGETAVQLNDNSTTELKVYNEKVLMDNVLIDGHTQYVCMDLSMILGALSQAGEDIDYDGSSKIMVKHEMTKNEIDSLTIPVTEGYYIEYVDGETKTIAGVTAKKAIIHVFNEEGEDYPKVIWYNDEMGPDINAMFHGVKGIALEFSQDYGEGKQVTFTATEIKKGKVKEVDMLLPSGYDFISEKDFENLQEQIREAVRYLQEED